MQAIKNLGSCNFISKNKIYFHGVLKFMNDITDKVIIKT